MSFFKAIWPIVTSFAVLLACIYNVSFWSVFDINPLAFLTLNQIILSSIRALILAFPGLIIGALISVGLRRLKNNAEIEGKTWSEKRRDISIYVFLSVTFLAGVISYVFGFPFWPALIGLPIAAISALLLAFSPAVDLLETSIERLFFGTFFCLSLSLFASTFGLIEAYKIVTGEDYLAASTEACADRYVGAVGDFLVFYGPETKETILVRAGSISEISLFPRNGDNCKT